MPFCSTAAIASRRHPLLVQQLVALLGHQHAVAVGDGHLLRLCCAPPKALPKHVAEIEHAHLRAGHAGDLEGRQARRRRSPALRPRSRGRRARPRAASCGTFCRVSALAPSPTSASSTRSSAASSALAADLLAQPLAGHADRDLDEIADDLLDIAADIADLGELGRLDLEEGRLGEPRQAARDLGLAARRSGPIIRMFFGSTSSRSLGQLLAAPAVAQRDRDGALGLVLADDDSGRARRRSRAG